MSMLITFLFVHDGIGCWGIVTERGAINGQGRPRLHCATLCGTEAQLSPPYVYLWYVTTLNNL